MIKSKIKGGVLLVGTLFLYNSMAMAQEDKLNVLSVQNWHVVRENAQKSFPKTVLAGNYSGITHLHDDIYAVVSDKSDSALFFNFRVQVNPKTGDLERVENLGFMEYVDGSHHESNLGNNHESNPGNTLYTSKPWKGMEKGFDHEAIAKVSDSTMVIASEGYYRLKEYPILSGDLENLWEMKWKADVFYPNYVFESLAFDSIRNVLWTIPESTLRKDGQPATPENGEANKLRLMGIDWKGSYANFLTNEKSYCGEGKAEVFNKSRESFPVDEEGASSTYPMKTFAYEMDKPSIHRKAETYVMGVSELCVLPDGQLLVLEREAFIPKIKLGAFCKCKLYIVNPWLEKSFPLSEPFDEKSPFINKRLLTEWKTGLSLFDRSFANYEGMCLGPQLEDGSQVLILLSDSQDQYAGVLKDWFKTIVIAK